jgi:predicted nucleic acid-binding protein
MIASLLSLLSPERPPLVTTQEVLIEFLTYFSGRGALFRRKAAAVAYVLQDDPDVRLVPQTSESFAAGLRLYAERPDKEYSLTDCISMAIMKTEGLTESTTGDRHFEQEGLRALFAPDAPRLTPLPCRLSGGAQSLGTHPSVAILPPTRPQYDKTIPPRCDRLT